jgi:hypothetical protein
MTVVLFHTIMYIRQSNVSYWLETRYVPRSFIYVMYCIRSLYRLSLPNTAMRFLDKRNVYLWCALPGFPLAFLQHVASELLSRRKTNSSSVSLLFRHYRLSSHNTSFLCISFNLSSVWTPWTFSRISCFPSLVTGMFLSFGAKTSSGTDPVHYTCNLKPK